MTPFAHYMLRIALPIQESLIEQKRHNLSGECETCGQPVKKGTHWCKACRTLVKPCAHCGEDFTTERGLREGQFCSQECSGMARHTPKKTAKHKPGKRMQSWAAK